MGKESDDSFLVIFRITVWSLSHNMWGNVRLSEGLSVCFSSA